MTTTIVRDDSAITAKKRAVWDWIDEHHPEWWDDVTTPGAPLTQKENLRRLAAVANAVPGGPWIGWTHVQTWVANIDRHSPYIDEIALERAMNFDWDAIRNLTFNERRELAERLADHPDPWGSAWEWQDEVMAASKTGGSRLVPVKPRAMAFRRGTKRERDRLQRLVTEARERREKAVVAEAERIVREATPLRAAA